MLNLFASWQVARGCRPELSCCLMIFISIYFLVVLLCRNAMECYPTQCSVWYIFQCGDREPIHWVAPLVMAWAKAETWPEYEQYPVQCNASGTDLAARLPPKRYRQQLLGTTACAFIAGAASVVASRRSLTRCVALPVPTCLCVFILPFS